MQSNQSNWVCHHMASCTTNYLLQLHPVYPSIFEAEEHVSGSPHRRSQSPPQCLSASPDCSIHVVEVPEIAAVDLFPSDTEVMDLFSEHSPSPRFDFLKLACLPCHRKFFSAGGLENHMYAVHDVLVNSSTDTPVPADNCPRNVQSSSKSSPPELLSFGPMTGPPKRPPFSSIVPAKTWASVAAKPAVGSSQPWSGRRIDFSASVGTTPRRPVGSRPSRPSVASQSSHRTRTPPYVLPCLPRNIQRFLFRLRLQIRTASPMSSCFPKKPEEGLGRCSPAQDAISPFAPPPVGTSI
ncbi:hypothetical protein CDAR_83431 [Caerostris darwini]|uniref:C2H2-type domain-containing protein n=1 Tax=Caerostris darwini TaxID=1538125 RepID=A0AAV4RUN5_9ARAC|nr:hypothetical protein CDAR_83431 [Caerostris darwini]